jgi:cytochrome c-type biogenesis protein CcmH/NrfF
METVMSEYSLTLSAHLLLWVFPVVLVVLVIVENLLDARSQEPE